ncbi:MAG: hypothetical protein DRP59_08325 [Spirochaetes bacterium]|nr:MAG: hypothetical protein DRP59_08325 [Spirochaetota bacterium]
MSMLCYLPPMLEMQGLIRFFDTGFILKMFFLVLLFSLFPVAEIFILIKASEYFNIYLLTSMIMVLSFLGFLIGYAHVHSTIKHIKRDINEGIFPEKKFFALAGKFAAAALLIVPGIGSFIAGLIILLPGINIKTGKLLKGGNRQKMKEVYEYLKLYDF